MPCFAVIKPSTEKWSRQANEFFKDAIKCAECGVCPISNGSNGILYCLLTKDNVNIGDLLIEYEYAVIDV